MNIVISTGLPKTLRKGLFLYARSPCSKPWFENEGLHNTQTIYPWPGHRVSPAKAGRRSYLVVGVAFWHGRPFQGLKNEGFTAVIFCKRYQAPSCSWTCLDCFETQPLFPILTLECFKHISFSEFFFVLMFLLSNTSARFFGRSLVNFELSSCRALLHSSPIWVTEVPKWLQIWLKHHTLEPPLKVSSATGWLQKSRCAMGFTQSPPSGNSFQVSGALGSHCSVGLWKSIASMALTRGKQVRTWLQSVKSRSLNTCTQTNLHTRLTFEKTPLTVSDTVPMWTIEFTEMVKKIQLMFGSEMAIHGKQISQGWRQHGETGNIVLLTTCGSTSFLRAPVIQFPPSPKKKT